jgi:glycine betaine/proline transport system permease protein
MTRDGIFFDFSRDLRKSIDAFSEHLVEAYGTQIRSVTDNLVYILRQSEEILTNTPPLVMLVIIGLIAYAVSRRVVFSVVMVALMYCIGLLGLWEEAMETLNLMLVSITLSILIGIPLGVLMARSALVRSIFGPVLDLMQTLPSFVYLIPVVMLAGLGNVSGIIATVIYATPPVVRLTDLGIREVSRDLTEAARAFGASRWQILRKVQIPLASATIMQGINQTTMMALAMVVIASIIGARGIGQQVLLGINTLQIGRGLLGGLAIVLLAIVLDRITQSFGRRVQAYKTAGH